MLSRSKKQLKRLLSGDTRVCIWEQHKLLYVRIPKSGNSSVVAAMGGGEQRRMFASRIGKMDAPWITFSFVRNPWARLVSTYTQKVLEIEDGIYDGFKDLAMPIKPGMGFEEFCEVVCDIPNKKIDKHLQSQSFSVIRQEAPIVSFVGKLEQMDADWQSLMGRAGLQHELPHLNWTTKRSAHYSSYYRSPALINRVGDRYADDLQHFNYDFDIETA